MRSEDVDAVVSAKLYVPSPFTSGLTSSASHVPDENDPEAAVATGARAGALVYVRVDSRHDVSATALTLTPAELAESVHSLSVAFVTGPGTPSTRNFRYPRRTGEASALTYVSDPCSDEGVAALAYVSSLGANAT